MKNVSFVLFAGGILGFAVSEIIRVRGPEVTADEAATTPSTRKNQDRIDHRISRLGMQTSKTSDSGTNFDQQSLGSLADRNDLDLNVLTVARILSEIGRLDEQEILELFDNPALVASDSYLIDQVKTSAVIRWMELLGPRAFRDLRANHHPAMGGPIDDMEVIAQGFGLWTLKHPDEARQWFEENMTGLEQLRTTDLDLWAILNDDDLLSAFIQSHERVRKGKTRELASLLPSEEAREDFLERLAQARVDQVDSPGALKDLLAHDDSFLQQQAIEKLIGVDPPFARDWISRQIVSEERDQVVANAADSYCEDDFQAGVQWYMQQELFTAEARSERLLTLASQWSYQEGNKPAAEWLQLQADTGERDQAEMFMARQSLHNQNFEEGITWISGISDSDLRQQLIAEFLPHEGLDSGIENRGNLLSNSARVNRNSIDAILNNPQRSSSEFIGTVDRVHIPGIPMFFSKIDRIKFREAAEQAGLIQPGEED